MTTGKKIAFLVAGILLLSAWTTWQAPQLEPAKWLLGTWENKTARGSMYEMWRESSEIELTGKSYILKDKDTVVFEYIRLVFEQGRLIYIPTVSNQNEGLPVRFFATSITPTQLIFENPAHDFPQSISYSKKSKCDQTYLSENPFPKNLWGIFALFVFYTLDHIMMATTIEK